MAKRLVLAGLLASILPCLTAPTLARPDARAENLKTEIATIEALAEQSYIWGMPLVEAALIRQRLGASLATDDNPSGLNRFRHLRRLSGPEMRAGAGPNNDTLYSSAWLDLGDGPIVVLAPDFGERYYTFSINSADSSSDMALGQRTHGRQLPPLFVHGPGYRGSVPAAMIDVRSRTRYVGIAGRILVRGEDDHAQVHALQDQIVAVRWQDWRAGLRSPAGPPSHADFRLPSIATSEAELFYRRLASVLQNWIVRPEDRAMVGRLGQLGLTVKDGFRTDRLTVAQVAAIARGYEKAREKVRRASLRLGVERNGWTINYRGPRFGKDDLLRAAVAKDQIFVAVPEEAVYPIGRVDAEGRGLDGTHRYRIRFAADQLPPVDAFWSITAYDDTGFMIPNMAKRYSVGDRTDGLVVERDGSVTVELASTPPPDEASVNWLPVAPNAPFYLMMRLYRPRQAVLDRSWVPPAVNRIAE